jgi:signal transduction histidine kinase
LRAEEQRDSLRQLEADLAHINRVSMMGELTASIAHEVNQLLSGVVSNGSACLRWLAGDVPNVEEARETARRIVRDGKRAGEIIARIRALATKRPATHKGEMDLNETIQEVLALVGDEAKKKSVTVRTEFADDLSPVSGDRVQLQQVALNLVMNAIEAMSSVGDRVRELMITTRNIDSELFRSTTKKDQMRESRESDAIIAIVDDDASVREGLETLIRSAGWRVQTFASAQEFLASLGGEAPSCLILDLQLPGFSGLDLQKRMA